MLATVATSAAQLPSSGKRYPRLIVRNATILEGNGTPASGPKDIVIEKGLISDIVPIDAGALKRPGFKRPVGDVEIDAAGKYIIPGLINLHGHVQEERAGIPQPLDYQLKLWLACGITTVRDVGSDLDRTLALRRESAEGRVAAPRIFVYPFFNADPAPRNASEARARVRELKAKGTDGIKILDVYRDVMEALEDE
ncbi:MAG: amidohydrolase, partial [Acidobacteria bacterium]